MDETVVHRVCYKMKASADGEQEHKQVLYVGGKLVRGSFHELEETEGDEYIVGEMEVVSKTRIF